MTECSYRVQRSNGGRGNVSGRTSNGSIGGKCRVSDSSFDSSGRNIIGGSVSQSVAAEVAVVLPLSQNEGKVFL